MLAWPCGMVLRQHAAAPCCTLCPTAPLLLLSAPCAVPPDSLLEVLAQSQGDAAVREAITALVAAMNANALARLAGLEQQVMRSVHAMRHVQQQLQVLELAGQAHRETIARLQSELAEARREAAHNLAALHAAQQLVDNTPTAAAVDAANTRADTAEADKRALQLVVERSWASGRRPPAPQRPWWQVWAARGSMVAVGALVGAAIGVPIDRRVRRAHRPGCSGRGSRAGGMFEVRAQRAAKG